MAGVVLAMVLVGAAITLPLGTIGSRPVAEATPLASVAGPSPRAFATPAWTRSPASAPIETLSPSPAQILEAGTDVGQLASDFELPSPEGQTLRLSDFRGHPVWVNFWAPWCPACRTEMPRLQGFYLQHEVDDLVILGVGVRDSPESMRAYASEVGVTYPIVVDGNGAVANAYGALALPVHYWIDRDGVIREWAFGELPPDLLAASLAKILPTAAP